MRKNKLISISLVLSILVLGINSNVALASESKEVIEGTQYEFGENSHYEIDEGSMNVVESAKNIGKLSINGNIKNLDEENSFKVTSGDVSISYSFSKDSLNTKEKNIDNWYLVDDKSKEINGEKISDKILSGSYLLQTSIDGKYWFTIKSDTDIFNKADYDSNIFTTTPIQLQNGCHYRVLVSYKMQRKSGTGALGRTLYETKKVSEVYEFYLEYKDRGIVFDKSNAYKVSNGKINTGKDTGFSGEIDINPDDPHYGWEIGAFYISGYTGDKESEEDNKKRIFFKNAGDEITLWFKLDQDINCLNKNDKLSIYADENGRDDNFEVGQNQFGPGSRGTLIIQQTDRLNNNLDPIVYTDFLVANTSTTAETRVNLLEEGDYKVALDYEIQVDGIVDTYYDYKIAFEFSIRNSNCMVFPLDIVTGSELSDKVITPNGFKIDLAKSKYLEIEVKKETILNNKDGTIKTDLRSDKISKDGQEFKEEGIYTITVTNSAVGTKTEKVIYVGDSPILLALASGYSIEDLNKAIRDGAIIDEFGSVITITPSPMPTDISETTTSTTVETTTIVETTDESSLPSERVVSSDIPDSNEEKGPSIYPFVIVLLLVGTVVAVYLLRNKVSEKNSCKHIDEESATNDSGDITEK